MTKVKELDLERLARWAENMSPDVQEVCKNFPPDRVYRLISHNVNVMIYGYTTSGLLIIECLPELNGLPSEFPSFMLNEVSPDDVEECDLPENVEVPAAAEVEMSVTGLAECLVFAARYAHTRRTGASQVVVNAIISCWDILTPEIQQQLKREANEALYNQEDWQRLKDHQ